MSFFGLPDWTIIFASAAVFSVLTAYISRKTGVKQKTEAIQKSIKDFQKEMTDAAKENNQKKIDELKIREPMVMKQMSDMMLLPFKNFIFIIPLFILFTEVIHSQFPTFLQPLPIALHLNGQELLGLNVFHESHYGPRGFFILSSIVSGMVIEQIWNRFSKKKPAQ
ncbi:DUF106 domain-containing protein [Candidatus Micrarchaeota archaeon]|nr:DUF106 domain-containing protein [Candidatus Micrarchaeota archaeon]